MADAWTEAWIDIHTKNIAELEKRVAALEKEFRAVFGKAEAVAIPVGWKECCFFDNKSARAFGGTFIYPSPSIPWGEGYEAILPEEAKEGDQYLIPGGDRWWKSGGGSTHPKSPSSYPWRRRKPPAEPAPGSDAEHPPVGYRLEPMGGKRAPGYVWWNLSTKKWDPGWPEKIGHVVECPWIANPIPANEGDSQKADDNDSRIQHARALASERDELRATVERLTAELDTTKRLLAESLVERDRLKNLHDARKVRIDGFRDALREHLGDLV